MYLRKALIGFCLATALLKFWPSDRWMITAPLAYWPTLTSLVFAIVLLLWVRRYATVFLGLIPLLLFTFYLENDRIFSRHSESQPGGIRIFHWNVWGGRSGSQKLAAFIAKNKPDIVCLNEPKNSIKDTHYPPYESYLGKEWDTLNAANVTMLSRFPLTQLEVYKGYGCGGLLARIEATPPLEILLLDVSPEFDMLRRKTFSQVKSSLTARASLPDIILGDFNTTSLALSLRPLYEMGYADAYHKAGSGIGYTWPNLLPMIKIDYILVQKKWKVTHHESGFTRLSDHAWQAADIRPL